MSNYTLTQRVYIEDTDAGGIVFYANYLRYMERARTEWLRSMGIELAELQHESELLFVVREVQIRFRSPARLDDLVEVHVQLNSLLGAGLVLNQPITRGSDVLVDSNVTLALLNAASMKPVRLTPELKDAIT